MYYQLPNKSGGPDKQGESEKFRDLINGGQNKRGGRTLEKALNDYTRTERTKTGCHKAQN